MRVLFARIGYMKFYQGPQKGDEKPIGGGSYNEDNIGHEAHNFNEINKRVYGCFQPYLKGEYDEVYVNIKRIDPSWKNEDQIDKVLVIFFATIPSVGGQATIGWYKNATVYRAFQKPLSRPKRGGFSYNIEAKSNDAILLPIRNRKQKIGHGIKGIKTGNPGQANAFYMYEENLTLKQEFKC